MADIGKSLDSVPHAFSGADADIARKLVKKLRGHSAVYSRSTDAASAFLAIDCAEAAQTIELLLSLTGDRPAPR